jgi:hypothetical protein
VAATARIVAMERMNLVKPEHTPKVGELGVYWSAQICFKSFMKPLFDLSSETVLIENARQLAI